MAQNDSAMTSTDVDTGVPAALTGTTTLADVNSDSNVMAQSDLQ